MHLGVHGQFGGLLGLATESWLCDVDLLLGENHLNVARGAHVRIDTTVSTVGAAALLHCPVPVSYTHLRAHETPEHLVCRLLLEKKKKKKKLSVKTRLLKKSNTAEEKKKKQLVCDIINKQKKNEIKEKI
eukprot:TRINITY_DN1294_c0_g1_i2.p1 TRINITY_DN1294_c0_g1~~TRINITY_DN1294_c0_g1_i2.p1  ORF type:complete len:130 (-),score=21.46 TRINITY_DN1294_c0_g1_i2:28-417(-)